MIIIHVHNIDYQTFLLPGYEAKINDESHLNNLFVTATNIPIFHLLKQPICFYSVGHSFCCKYILVMMGVVQDFSMGCSGCQYN